MDADRKWHLAWAQLDAFKKNLPGSVEEKHVTEFHAILMMLQEASGEDVSPFRIPDDELRRAITSIRRGTRRFPSRASYSKEKHCDPNLMSRQIDAVYGYFKRLQPPPGEPEKNKYGF